MTCAHTPNYQTGCVPYIVRKIRALRSPDTKTTLKLQRAMFANMPIEMAAEVKEILRRGSA